MVANENEDLKFRFPICIEEYVIEEKICCSVISGHAKFDS